MTLLLFRDGRFLRYAQVVDLLDQLDDEGLSTPGVFRRLWMDGLILIRDKFRYSVEVVDGHRHHALEVWCKQDCAPFEWRVMMTLKETTPEAPIPQEPI